MVCENAKTGTSPDVWDIEGAGDAAVQGFATDMSVNAGDTVSFKVKAQYAYTVDIYRVGYYGGDGARKVVTLPGTFPAQNQNTECVTDPATQIYDCGTWAVSASWAVPATAVSGVYFAMLSRTDGRRRQPHHVRRPRRHQHLRRDLQDLRRDVAGLQPVRRLGLLFRAERAGDQAQLQPAVRHPRRGERPGLPLQ